MILYVRLKFMNKRKGLRYETATVLGTARIEKTFSAVV